LSALYLAFGATLLATLLAVPLVFYLHTYAPDGRLRRTVRLTLDIL
jgi:phosphate transport system permease protein